MKRRFVCDLCEINVIYALRHFHMNSSEFIGKIYFQLDFESNVILQKKIVALKFSNYENISGI